MPGLRKIAKAYGGLVAKNKDKAVIHKWDDEKDGPYVAAEMTREEYDRREREGPAFTGGVKKRQMVGADDLVSFAEGLGYKAIAVTNTTAAAEGVSLAVIGFELRGPRGNKHFIPRDRNGQFSLDDAKLWADCVEYASAKGRFAR